MNKDQLYFYNRGFNDCLAKGLNPIKEFTDEEIAKIALENYDGKSALVDKNLPWHYTIVSFARAILRKAQEK